MNPIRLAVLGLLLAGATLGWWQSRQLAAAHLQLKQLGAELQSYQATVAMMQRAATIHSAYVAEQLAAANDQAALDRNLQSLEGRNAPLSDHLRNASGILWP